MAAIDEWPLAKRQAVGCLECGLLFCHPQPSEAALEAYYSADGGWKEKRPDPPAGKAATKTKRAATAVMSTLDRFFAATQPASGARVLDFGCGTGAWLNSFQDHGWQTFGIEPSTRAAFARHRELTAVPSEPSFDLVILYHVLEHLPRPLRTLSDLAQALKPGGFCFISIPRLDTVGVHGDMRYCLNPQKHIVAFTEACLTGLLARAGMQAVVRLDELDAVFSKGTPVRLRLLAQKAIAPARPRLDPQAALRGVVEQVARLSNSR